MLRARGSYCGVRYKTQVIAKKRPAQHHCNKKRHTAACGIGKLHSQRRESHHRAHRCANAQRNKAHCREQARYEPLHGQQPQRDAHHCINRTHALGKCRECSGKHKYPNHLHHITVGCSARENHQSFAERCPTSGGNSPYRCHNECQRQWHAIKIAYHQTRCHIEQQEHRYWRDGKKPTPRCYTFFVFFLFHNYNATIVCAESRIAKHGLSIMPLRNLFSQFIAKIVQIMWRSNDYARKKRAFFKLRCTACSIMRALSLTLQRCVYAIFTRFMPLSSKNFCNFAHASLVWQCLSR